MATIAIGISKGPGTKATATVPVNSLSEDGVAPEEGDTFECSIQGTVQSVEGSMATVSIDSVNGEPVGEESSESPEEESSEEQQEPTSGASPRTNLDPMMAPMGPAPSPAPLRKRLDRKGTDAIRKKLLKGASKVPLF